MAIINNLFSYEYLRNAYIIGLLIGVLAPIIGAYVVMKRLSLIVDGVSHVTLSGISLGLFVNKLGYAINPMYFGMIFALIGSFIIEIISNSFKKFREVAVPITISFASAVTAILVSLSGGFSADLSQYLFGSILTTSKFEIYVMSITLIVVLFGLKTHYYDFLSYAIDEDYCKFAGINTKNYKNIFTILIAVVVSVSIKAVGMMLVSALVIIPISCATKFCKSFKQTLLVAIIISEISVFSGLISSYYLNIPSGAMIVVVNILFFIIISIMTNRKGTKK